MTGLFCLTILIISVTTGQGTPSFLQRPANCDKDVRLAYSVLSTHGVYNRLQCYLKCLDEPACLSFNFEDVSENKTRVCELNSKIVDKRGNNLKTKKGFAYYEKTSGFDNGIQSCTLTETTYVYTDIHLQSRNFPTYYFSYDTSASDRAKILLDDRKTFRILRPGLTGEEGTVSIESNDKPGHFFRYRADTNAVDLWGTDPESYSPETFYEDATFKIRYGTWFNGYLAFEAAYNPGKYISHGSHLLSVSSFQDTDVYKNSVSFKILPAPTYLQKGVKIQSYNYQSYFMTYDSNTNYCNIINGDFKTFNIWSPGLTGVAGTVSIESVDKPHWFFRYKISNSAYTNLEYRPSPAQGSSNFDEEATFIIRQDILHTGWFALEASTMSNYYLRHSYYPYVYTDIHLQSKNFPTYYFSYDTSASDRAKILLDDRKTFRILRPGLTGDEGTVSIESNDKPGHFFRYRADTNAVDLWGTDPESYSPETFYEDATFKIRYGTWFTGYLAFEAAYDPGKYISHGSHLLSVSSFQDTDVYKNSVSFKILPAPTYLQKGVKIQSYNFQSYFMTYDSNTNYCRIINGDAKTFNIWIPGLTGVAGTMSIESVDKPHWFFRYKISNSAYTNLEYRPAPAQGSLHFDEEATFIIRQDILHTGWFALEASTMATYYLRHINYRIYLHQHIQTSPDAAFRFV
ncbi:uncharacterized protein LOC106154099 [Lingula anatina]|uniref:Uncharacterized protein LOC106154099 n=1 Tax=Lingula anatina TaxID=7574 RepID=A0A1S3HFI9_LINAN|nr:uncharacterized protein LOC106154099 [Lingula anatina]|eukprot:XP_013383804.1 uncharacterized protein LOC106154099 [Lingula anatina]